MKLKLCATIFSYLLFLSITLNRTLAQQVTKVDCCLDVGSKATIIINNNSSNVNSVPSNATVIVNSGFNFTLNTAANTSAGIYNSSGVLLRTLWSGIPYAAGCYSAQWDGNLDDGTAAPLGNYTVKVLTNNVQYTWEGVVGNSSTDLTGDYVQKTLPLAMCFIGTTGYVAGGYSEHVPQQKQFLTSDPNKSSIPHYGGTTQSSERVCTDGNIIYWAGGNYYNNDYWVFGAYPANNGNPAASMVPFSSGVTESFSDASGSATYTNTISVTKNNANGHITDICVQNTGNFLFVARSGINQVQVVDKRVSSGATLQTLTFSGIKGMVCDDNGHLFLSYANLVKRFNINTDGTLTDSGISFSGLTTPGTLGISPDFATLAIADDATNQTKFYNTSNGTATGNILGEGGSFATNPYATADRFYHIDYIAYQPDGKIWIGDTGNARVVLLQADGTYVNQITNVPSSYNVTVDPNNPIRVFNNLLEYERDYSKPLDNGTNGSWKLKANWKAGFTGSYDTYAGFNYVVTLNNGKTYGKVYSTGIGYSLVELTPTGLRYISANFNGNIGSDGTVFNTQNNGSYVTVSKQVLTGFDGSNNPVWAAPVVFVTTPSGTNNEYSPGWAYENNTGHTNLSDKYVFFNNSGPPSNGNPDGTLGYHLGAIKTGQNSYLWKTSRSTFTSYTGDYPNNGDFDIGNGWPGQHSLTHAMVYGHDIFWNVNGEFWKPNSGAPEINIWNHFYDDGLFVGQFGITGPKAALTGSSPAMMAGNAIVTSMTKVGNDYYIYHCDESVHAGIHSWHVTGINTIAEQSIPVTVSSTITPVAAPTDLMAGIPYKSTGFYGGNGWAMNPSAAANGWSVTTTQNAYLKSDNDVYIQSDGNAGGVYKTVTRTLGVNNTNNWTLSFQYQINGNLNDNYNLDVLDASGKILLTFRTQYSFHLINGAQYLPGTVNANLLRFGFVSFVVKNINGAVTASIDGNATVAETPNDSGGNFSQPATFRIRAGGSGDNNHTLLSVKGLRFVGQ